MENDNIEIDVDTVSTYAQIKQRKANQEQAVQQDELKNLILDLKKEVKSLKTEVMKNNGGEE